jgi:hypothetical protein
VITDAHWAGSEEGSGWGRCGATPQEIARLQVRERTAAEVGGEGVAATKPGEEGGAGAGGASSKSRGGGGRGGGPGSKLVVIQEPMGWDIVARYELGRELGHSEFGVTYLYTDHATRDALACKSISKKFIF